MLCYLHEPKPYRLSNRDRQLFAVACCRRVWDRLDGVSRSLVELAEQCAHGAADLETCENAYEALKSSSPENIFAAYAAVGALMCRDDAFSSIFMDQPATDAAYRFVTSAAICCAMLVGEVVPHALHPNAVWDAAGLQERAAQCELLRGIVGDPTRSSA
jgi:hypothetical protein